jgi:hypothetical protein
MRPGRSSAASIISGRLLQPSRKTKARWLGLGLGLGLGSGSGSGLGLGLGLEGTRGLRRPLAPRALAARALAPHAVHLVEQRRERALRDRAVAAVGGGCALGPQRVDLVNEDDRRRGLARLGSGSG